MNSKIEKIENSQVKITMELNKEEWSSEIVNAYHKTKGKYSVPGFRKGKVPMKVLVQSYGEGMFYEDAVNGAFRKYYPEVLDANTDVEVVGSPEIDVEDISEEGMTMVAIAPVKPEFELPQYKGMNIEKVEYTVTDADIDAEVAKKAEQGSRMVDAEGRAAAMGDSANIDFAGSIDGEIFEGGTGAGFDLVLGSNSFIPGFEEGVVGMNIGDTKVIDVPFPETYHEASLAGKMSQFEVVLNSLKVKEMPTLDDEFAKDVSEFDTLAEMKADIKEKLEASNEAKSLNETENNILKAICDAVEITIPQAMIEDRAEQMLQDFSYRLMYQGLNVETYLQYTGQDMEAFKATFLPEAEKAVKSQLVVDKIIALENIEADEASIDAEIAKIAEQSDKSVEEYKKEMPAEHVDYVTKNVVINKLFDFLRTENLK
ncbi:MAG: trigger factor [Bacillota bacterium]